MRFDRVIVVDWSASQPTFLDFNAHKSRLVDFYERQPRTMNVFAHIAEIPENTVLNVLLFNVMRIPCCHRLPIDTLALKFLAHMRYSIFFATGITGSGRWMVWRKLSTDGIAGRC